MIARGSYRPHTIVPGASIDRNQRDDVFAGHAVFLWLRTPVPDAPGTWETCNTACMDQVRASPDTANRAAKCFIDRVTAASPFIRWGGALPGADSTRFDGFLVNTPALWEQYAVESKISFDSGCFARAPVRARPRGSPRLAAHLTARLTRWPCGTLHADGAAWRWPPPGHVLHHARPGRLGALRVDR